MSDCVFSRVDGTCATHGGGAGPCLVRMGEAMQAQRARDRQGHADDCAYVHATLWWKAEALLATVGKATPMDRLLLAAVIPIPIPRDVAEAHMEEAKAAILAWEQARGSAGRGT
jgi:hypothetical protein